MRLCPLGHTCDIGAECRIRTCEGISPTVFKTVVLGHLTNSAEKVGKMGGGTTDKPPSLTATHAIGGRIPIRQYGICVLVFKLTYP